MASSTRPIAKSCLVFIAFFVLLSVVVYRRLEEIDDDDIVASSTQMNRHVSLRLKGKHHHKHKHPGIQHQIHELGKYLKETRWLRHKTHKYSAREIYEREHTPVNKDRWHKAVAELRKDEPNFVAEPMDTYHIHDCPPEPPAHYPHSWRLGDVLENWAPKDFGLPSNIYQGLCVFDWEIRDDRLKAQTYRDQELPFVVQNYPDVMIAAERWNFPGYLEHMIGGQVEHQNNEKHHHNQHEYKEQGKLFSDWKKNAYLYEELPLFDPSIGQGFTMVDPTQHQGINCGFEMQGLVSKSHYDVHNNFVTLMGGQRRYILAHPDQCQNMDLHPKGHSSAGHSKIDWNTLGTNSSQTTGITNALVNEIVLQAGDLLYLPTYWFHFTVSLNTNYQCNSRSGVSLKNSQHIIDCGFDATSDSSAINEVAFE